MSNLGIHRSFKHGFVACVLSPCNLYGIAECDSARNLGYCQIPARESDQIDLTMQPILSRACPGRMPTLAKTKAKSAELALLPSW